MSARRFFLVWLITACTAGVGCTADEPDDPCDERPVVAGGSAELGLGFDFTPVADHEQVDLVLGTQGLWMFIVNARAQDMELGSGDGQGITIDAVDANGARVSLDPACRTREFEDQGNGTLQLASAFLLPLLPDVTPILEGATITLRLEIRDARGRRATDQRTIVAHLPNR